MKIILVVIVVLVFSGNSYARCVSSLLEVFPKTATLKQDSWIILEGYGESEKLINALNKAYFIRLLSEKDTVKLEIQSINKGLVGVTQAVLVPVGKLLVGQQYRLDIDGLEKKHPFLQREIVWTAAAAVSTTAFKWLSQPELLEQHVTHFGCGPEVYSSFKIETENRVGQWVKTELLDLETLSSTTYLLKMEAANTLNVGHGMCYGPFDYKEGRRYKVRFSLVDTYAKEADKWSAWVELKSPFDTDTVKQNTNILYWMLPGGLLLSSFIFFVGRKL